MSKTGIVKSKTRCGARPIKTRDTIELIKNHVVKQQQNLEHSAVRRTCCGHESGKSGVGNG